MRKKKQKWLKSAKKCRCIFILLAHFHLSKAKTTYRRSRASRAVLWLPVQGRQCARSPGRTAWRRSQGRYPRVAHFATAHDNKTISVCFRWRSFGAAGWTAKKIITVNHSMIVNNGGANSFFTNFSPALSLSLLVWKIDDPPIPSFLFSRPLQGRQIYKTQPKTEKRRGRDGETKTQRCVEA